MQNYKLFKNSKPVISYNIETRSDCSFVYGPNADCNGACGGNAVLDCSLECDGQNNPDLCGGEPNTENPGCMDPNAINTDPNAVCDCCCIVRF